MAAALGALRIRIEQRFQAPQAAVVFRRRGLPEIYEHSLTWIPEQLAADVRQGALRLGESREHVDGGWWWVVW